MSLQVRAYLFLVITTLLWSGNFIVGRASNAEIGPLTLSMWRWIVVAALLLPWTLRQLKRHPLTLRQYRNVFIMGVLGVSCYNTFVYIGLQYTSAPNGVLFNSTVPFWVLFVQWLAMGKRLNRKDVFGLILSLFGVVILVSQGQLGNLLALEFSRGDIWIVSAAICWGVYTAMLPHWRPDQLDVLSYLGLLALLGVGFIIIGRLINPFDEPALVWNGGNIFAVIYVSVFASIFAWVCFMEGVKIIGSEIGGQSIHLMPVFVAILAYFILGEALQGYHYLGAAFILAGLIASNKVTLFKKADLPVKSQ